MNEKQKSEKKTKIWKPHLTKDFLDYYIKSLIPDKISCEGEIVDISDAWFLIHSGIYPFIISANAGKNSMLKTHIYSFFKEPFRSEAIGVLSQLSDEFAKKEENHFIYSFFDGEIERSKCELSKMVNKENTIKDWIKYAKGYKFLFNDIKNAAEHIKNAENTAFNTNEISWFYPFKKVGECEWIIMALGYLEVLNNIPKAKSIVLKLEKDDFNAIDWYYFAHIYEIMFNDEENAKRCYEKTMLHKK